MSRAAKPISLYPLSVADALAAMLRVPPPPKTTTPAKRRASKHRAKRKS